MSQPSLEGSSPDVVENSFEQQARSMMGLVDSEGRPMMLHLLKAATSANRKFSLPSKRHNQLVQLMKSYENAVGKENWSFSDANHEICRSFTDTESGLTKAEFTHLCQIPKGMRTLDVWQKEQEFGKTRGGWNEEQEEVYMRRNG